MERFGSTGQSPQLAVASTEEGEKDTVQLYYNARCKKKNIYIYIY
jgi:hypothetical protein